MATGFLTLLIMPWVIEVVAAFHDNITDFCKDYGEAFERVFTVPQEAALLNCELVNEHVFEFLNTPYNVTWYDQRTGLEITGEDDYTIIQGNTLWFLNITMEHQSHYLCVIRTPEKCYKQEIVVKVEKKEFGECGRPQKGLQRLQMLVNANLRCPLSDYIKGVDSYFIHWYKDCELLQEGPRFTFRRNKLELHLHNVSPLDAGIYTCRMTFALAGAMSEVSETIKCEINEPRSKRPQIIEPTNKIIKVFLGSQLKTPCRVFVPGLDVHMVVVLWMLNNVSVSLNTSDRVHQESLIEHWVADGVWLERTLSVSPLLQEDLNLNFVCKASSYRGHPTGYFTLQPADPDLLLPIGLLLAMMAVMFIMGLLVYKVFKVELTLLFRTLFCYFYASTDGDGKLYDAYVVYPQFERGTLSESVEIFAVKTLPEVLEERYGYRLFILGRDSLPGQVMADVVENTMNLCRRLLLLYSGSSLCSTEGLAWLEQQTGLHQGLVDDSLTVVLLEMEEVSDPSVLPESLRLLRERKGALQAWKKRSWWFRSIKEERLSAETLSSFALSARFWREVLYHMPVRGKAKCHLRKCVTEPLNGYLCH